MKTANIVLEYQDYISQPPISSEQLHVAACSNDKKTVEHWHDIWLANMKANKETYGDFSSHSVGKLWGLEKYKPCIVAGSGPSLKNNAAELKNKNGIPLISCLHNFHYLEDAGAGADYYCTLDAGDITIKEVTEGGSRSEEEYWELTKDRKLIAFIASPPELLKKWKGEVYFFNAPIPDNELGAKIDAIEKFHVYISNGGNVLGTCLYFAKSILGCHTTIFVGADFSFGYPEIKDGEAKAKFHSWNSSYDKTMGRTIKVTDVYGNKVRTWPSYYNFKHYFDWVAINVPGEYINCTEGGSLGAYPQGNLSAFKFMDLKDCFRTLMLSEEIKECCENPKVDYKKIIY